MAPFFISRSSGRSAALILLAAERLERPLVVAGTTTYTSNMVGFFYNCILMPRKLVPTGRKRVFRKRRFVKRVAAVSRASYASLTIKRMAYPLPPKLRLSLRCNDISDVTLGIAQSYDAYYFPLYFPGLFKDSQGTTPKFAGGFIPLMLNYSKAYVRGVRIHVRAFNLSSGNNHNCNMFTAILPEGQAVTYGSLGNQTEFENLSNSVQAKKWFVGDSTGGHGYAQDYRYCDLVKYNGYSNLLDNQIIRTVANQITTPSAGEANNQPNYLIGLQHGPGTASGILRIEHTFDFDIEFSELAFMPQLIADFSAITFSRRT